MQTPLLLSMQGTYATTEIALSSNGQIIRTASVERDRSSAGLVPLISDTLKRENFTIKNVTHIAVDQGPGAFISLRVSVVIANAISFATKIPLIGINGLDALIHQVRKSNEALIKSSNATLMVALLNAYSHDVYASYCPTDPYILTPSMPSTALKIDTFLRHLAFVADGHKILLTGNGAAIHRSLIEQTPGLNCVFEPTITSHCTVKTIAELAQKRISSRTGFVTKLSPIYLKQGMSTH